MRRSDRAIAVAIWRMGISVRAPGVSNSSTPRASAASSCARTSSESNFVLNASGSPRRRPRGRGRGKFAETAFHHRVAADDPFDHPAFQALAEQDHRRIDEQAEGGHKIAAPRVRLPSAIGFMRFDQSTGM